MRVVTFDPGAEWPRIEHIDDSEFCAPIAITVLEYLGVKLWALSAPDATHPNRIIDGRVINGRFRLCHPGGRGLSLEFAQRIRDNCEWPMAQYATCETEVAYVR